MDQNDTRRVFRNFRNLQRKGDGKKCFLRASLELDNTKTVKLLKNKAYTITFLGTDEDPNAKKKQQKQGLMNFFDLLEKYKEEDELGDEEEARFKEEELKRLEEEERMRRDEEQAIRDTLGEHDRDHDGDEEEDEEEEEAWDRAIKEEYDDIIDIARFSTSLFSMRSSEQDFTKGYSSYHFHSSDTLSDDEFYARKQHRGYGSSDFSDDDVSSLSSISEDSEEASFSGDEIEYREQRYLRKVNSKINRAGNLPVILKIALLISFKDLKLIRIEKDYLDDLKENLRTREYLQRRYITNNIQEAYRTQPQNIAKIVLNMAHRRLLDARKFIRRDDVVVKQIKPIKPYKFKEQSKEIKKYLNIKLMPKKESELFIPVKDAYLVSRKVSLSRYFCPISLPKRKRRQFMRRFDETQKHRLDSMSYVDFKDLARHPSGLNYPDFCIKYKYVNLSQKTACCEEARAQVYDLEYNLRCKDMIECLEKTEEPVIHPSGLNFSQFKAIV